MNTAFSINDICERIITPAIKKSGWSRESQISFCDDIDFAYKQLDTEYVLYYKSGIPVAVVSVIGKDKEMGAGIEKAIYNAKYLDVPCAFSSNGSGFVFYNRAELPETAKMELEIDRFPRPEELWKIYLGYQNIKNTASKIQSAIDKGFTQFFIGVSDIGGRVLSIAFKILDNMFTSKADKRILYLTNQEDYLKCDEWAKGDIHGCQLPINNAHNQRENTLQGVLPLNYIQLQNNDMKIYYSSLDDFKRGFDIKINIKSHLYFFDIIFLERHDNDFEEEAKCQCIMKHFTGIPLIVIKAIDKSLEGNNACYGQTIYVDVMDQPVDNIDDSCTAHINKSDNRNRHITKIPTSHRTYNQTNGYNIKLSKSVDNNKTTINNTIMARQTSFSHQIELAEDLKSYLLRLQDNLDDAAQKYIKKSNSLYEAGMMDEKHQVLEEYMYETVGRIKSIVEQINESDIPFVERLISYLEESDAIK